MGTPSTDRNAGVASPAGPVDLNALLQVQPQAIVSRVLLKNRGGSVTLFAFDAGEGLSEHTAPFDALLVGVEGDAEVEISGARFQLHRGQAITLPAGKPHAVRALAPFKMLLLMVRE